MHVGRIQSHKDRIEVEPAHRLEQNGRVVVPGHAQMAHAPLASGLQERLESTARRENPS